MPPEISDKWLGWRREVVRRAEGLVSRLRISDLPVPLRPVVKASGVNKIELRPLLMDGGLAQADDGFTIYVDCPVHLRDVWYAALNDDRDQGRSIPGASRFTIAHEVAHTFFFRRESAGWIRMIEADHPKEIQSLERTCNLAASRLLVPENLLGELVSGLDRFSPRNVISLADKFNVSTHVLVGRLGNLSRFEPSRSAMVAVISRGDSGLRLRALASDTRTSEAFPAAKVGRPAQYFVGDRRLQFLGGTERRIRIRVPESGGRTALCEVECEAVPGRNFWIVTAQLSV
jgi:IrrE N-terminal-like domain